MKGGGGVEEPGFSSPSRIWDENQDWKMKEICQILIP
jgi:hypothetical protein